MSFIKQNLIALIAIGLFFFLFFSEMNGCGKNPTGGRDTLRVEKETIYEQQPPIYIERYTPPIVVDTGSHTKEYVIPPGYMPAGEYAALREQYEDLVRKHVKSNRYNDTIILKDSSGKEVGKVNIKDEVSENVIKNREPSYQLNFPHTYTTVTVAEEYRQFYGHIGLTGTPAQIVNGGNIGIAYKNKKDKMIEAKIGIIQVEGNTTPYGEIGLKVPLGKKK